MKITLLKTMKENVCLERQGGDTWCLLWEGDFGEVHQLMWGSMLALLVCVRELGEII